MKYVVFLLAAFAVIPYSSATYITINAQLPEIYADTDNATAKSTVSNTGDEAAYSVLTSLVSADGLESQPLFVDKLMPGQQVDTSFTVNVTRRLVDGRYPLVIITEYADANNYPFSAVSSSFLTYKQRTASMLTGVFEEVQIAKGGTTKAKLKIMNRDASEKNITLRIFVPKELAAGGYAKILRLKGDEQKTIGVEISSLSALQGSAYTTFAVMEYEEGGKHYAYISRGLATITKNSGVFSNEMLAVALVVTAATIAAYNMKKRKTWR